MAFCVIETCTVYFRPESYTDDLELAEGLTTGKEPYSPYIKPVDLKIPITGLLSISPHPLFVSFSHLHLHSGYLADAFIQSDLQ